MILLIIPVLMGLVPAVYFIFGCLKGGKTGAAGAPPKEKAAAAGDTKEKPKSKAASKKEGEAPKEGEPPKEADKPAEAPPTDKAAEEKPAE